MTHLALTGISAPKTEPSPGVTEEARPEPAPPTPLPPAKRLVVVTGASTGIGYATTQALVERGYPVAATVRNAEDGARLRAELGEAVHPLLLDVSDDEAVVRAAGEIEQLAEARGLAGLVNNAGVAVAGPLMHVDLEVLRYQFDVNVVGVVAMTQALLPLLRGDAAAMRPPGRVINMGSVSGYMTYPFLAPYAASKHALESITEGMRRELMIYDIAVVSMVLGAVKTPIWTKAVAEDLTRYATTDYAAGVKLMHKTTEEIAETAMPAARIARAVLVALEHPKPKTRYVLVNNYWGGWLLPRLFPRRWFDWALARQFDLTPKP
jgi:NAD(P)-dependent dehydrogenase (short-subunit alcohol dehydrogenase family)